MSSLHFFVTSPLLMYDKEGVELVWRYCHWHLPVIYTPLTMAQLLI